MVLTTYHNPRCSKSRQALQLLRDNGIELKIIEYLKNPPDKRTLKRLIKMLIMDPGELMCRKEKEYDSLGLSNPALSEDELIEAMVEHPKLIERPVVVSGNKAVLGRPPEQVLKVL